MQLLKQKKTSLPGFVPRHNKFQRRSYSCKEGWVDEVETSEVLVVLSLLNQGQRFVHVRGLLLTSECAD